MSFRMLVYVGELGTIIVPGIGPVKREEPFSCPIELAEALVKQDPLSWKYHMGSGAPRGTKESAE